MVRVPSGLGSPYIQIKPIMAKIHQKFGNPHFGTYTGTAPTRALEQNAGNTCSWIIFLSLEFHSFWLISFPVLHRPCFVQFCEFSLLLSGSI